LKIKVPKDILIIDILSVLLILSVIFIPVSIARIILGLPFLLFFPGYILVAVLFPKSEMDIVERIAVSFGISIVAIGLIDIGLNYTPWGIRLEPELYSIFVFVFILSIIAIVRRRSYGRKDPTSVNIWGISRIFKGSTLNKTLNIIMIVAILGMMGSMIYVFAKPKVGEKLSEFYILGVNGMAEDYPTKFVLGSNMMVVSVQYGSGTPAVSEKWGRVMLDIVNQEQQNTSYTVVMQIDSAQVDIPFQGNEVKSIGPIDLAPEEKWEQEIGIVPQHTGQNQEVELLLYKNSEAQPSLNVHLFINVTQ